MAAGTHNISIVRGTDYALAMTLKDNNDDAINVTNYTFKSEIRRKQSAGVAVAFTITKTSASNGVIKLALTAAQTRSLPNGKLLWDMVADDGSEISQYVSGIVTVSDTVTDTSGL